MKLRKSTNGGATFQSITNGPSFGRIVGQDIGDARVSNSPSLVVGTDNALYLTYDDWDSSGTYALRVKFAKSTNSGLSWNNTRTIGRIAEGKQFFPSITIDTRNRGNAPLLV